MSKTLDLIEAGWESVRATAARGQRADALSRLTGMLARPDLPAAMLAEGRQLAGELAFELGRYATARRHLKVAIALVADDAATRYLLGRAWEEDPDGCDRRAAICFKKAVALDAATPLYRAAFGRAAARCGKVKLGTREMLAAAAQSPGDVTVIRAVVGGLLDAGKPADARRVVETAGFLGAGDHELTALRARVQFENARLVQQQLAKATKTRESTRDAQDAQLARDGDRVLLPFMRLTTDADPVERSAKSERGGTVRRDAMSFPRPHLARLRAGKAER